MTPPALVPVEFNAAHPRVAAAFAVVTHDPFLYGSERKAYRLALLFFMVALQPEQLVPVETLAPEGHEALAFTLSRVAQVMQDFRRFAEQSAPYN